MIESQEYRDGKDVALHCLRLTGLAIARMRQSSDFWEGFHSNRPHYTDKRSDSYVSIEDPTRPGGWCVLPHVLPAVVKPPSRV